MSNGQAEIERLEAATSAFEAIITTEEDSVEVPNVGPTPSLKKRVEEGLDERVPGPHVYMQSANSDVDKYGYPLRSLYKNGDGMIAYYPEYSVFRKTKNVWERLDPHPRNVITLNGVSQYLVFPEISIGAEVSLTVKPLSGGNTGLPSDCPLLVDGEIQTVEFILTEAMSELGRNGSSYFHGIPLGMIVDGVNYRFDEGWRTSGLQTLVNYATDFGEELILPEWQNFDTLPIGQPDSTYYTQIASGEVQGVDYLFSFGVSNYAGSQSLGMLSGAYFSTFKTVSNNAGRVEVITRVGTAGAGLFNRSINQCTYENVTMKQADGYGEYVGLTEASWTKETVNA